METRKSTARLEELRRLMVLESQPERQYDVLVKRLGTAMRTPLVKLNMLDEDRDWFKASVGLTMCEGSAEKSMCNIFFETQDDVVVVADTLLDARFFDHEFVTGQPKIRFYAAARLVSSGHTVGTLCAYDTVPKRLTDEQMDILKTLAAEAARLLVARKDTHTTRA